MVYLHSGIVCRYDFADNVVIYLLENSVNVFHSKEKIVGKLYAVRVHENISNDTYAIHKFSNIFRVTS